MSVTQIRRHLDEEMNQSKAKRAGKAVDSPLGYLALSSKARVFSGGCAGFSTSRMWDRREFKLAVRLLERNSCSTFASRDRVYL
jgi:hypothetical protein